MTPTENNLKETNNESPQLNLTKRSKLSQMILGQSRFHNWTFSVIISIASKQYNIGSC